jgi:hypothetical protein
MKPDQLRDFLNAHGVIFEEQEIPYGRKFKCEEGEIFVAYDSGKVVCQGETSTEFSKTVKDFKKSAKPAPAQTKEQTPAEGEHKPVFIVYGHDKSTREGLELVLHPRRLRQRSRSRFECSHHHHPVGNANTQLDTMRWDPTGAGSHGWRAG